MENRLADVWDWSRRMTLRERLLSIGEALVPPLAMQFVVEGKGLLDQVLIQQKLQTLARFVPALMLKLEGSKWTFNGQVPQLIVHHYSIPADRNNPVFSAPLNARSGLCFEFHLFQTDRSALLVRVLHSAMDGVGALKLIEHLFSLLNHKQVPFIKDHPKDHVARRAIGKTPATIRGGYTRKWKGLAKETKHTPSSKFILEAIEWRKRIDGVTASVVKWYMDQTGEPARFMIPVNIRRHGIYTEALSNLSMPIYLKTTPDQSREDIQSQLLKKLADRHELAYEPTETLGGMLPSSVLRSMFVRMIPSAQRADRYPFSGFISDLGKVELDNFSAPGFEAMNFFALPVFVPLSPFCLTACCHKYGTRIAFSVPDYYDSESIKQSLKQMLSPVQNIEESTFAPEPAEIELAKRLTVSWSEVLKIPTEEIGLNDRFSDLGGESISFLFLINEVSSKYVPDKQSLFMNEIFKLAGSVSVQSMISIITRYQKRA